MVVEYKDLATGTIRKRAGTGVFAIHDGQHIIVTAYHLVKGALRITAAAGKSSPFPIEDVAHPRLLCFPELDVAVLEVTADGLSRLQREWKGSRPRYAEKLEPGAHCHPGAAVSVVGNPVTKIGPLDDNRECTAPNCRESRPLNRTAREFVSEYVHLQERLPDGVVVGAATSTKVLMLSGTAVTYGFSGGPVFYSSDNFSSDMRLVGILLGGGGEGSAESWAVRTDAIYHRIQESTDDDWLFLPRKRWPESLIGGRIARFVLEYFVDHVRRKDLEDARKIDSPAERLRELRRLLRVYPDAVEALAELRAAEQQVHRQRRWNSLHPSMSLGAQMEFFVLPDSTKMASLVQLEFLFDIVDLEPDLRNSSFALRAAMAWRHSPGYSLSWFGPEGTHLESVDVVRNDFVLETGVAFSFFRNTFSVLTTSLSFRLSTGHLSDVPDAISDTGVDFGGVLRVRVLFRGDTVGGGLEFAIGFETPPPNRRYTGVGSETMAHRDEGDVRLLFAPGLSLVLALP